MPKLGKEGGQVQAQTNSLLLFPYLGYSYKSELGQTPMLALPFSGD